MATCQSCGTDNAADATFCSACGEKLDTAPSKPREIRKTVTVIFCDVTDSTELGERLDPESLRSVMSRYFDRMKSVLEAHGGTVEKFIGDAVMAVFGVPALHEDDALRAVRAAHEMRTALAELNDEFESELSVSLATRIGVNTGSVVTGPATGQHLVTGDAVNVAARLEQAADAGEILIGSDTFDLTRDAIDAEPVDPLDLKGKAKRVDAYRLLSVRPGALGHERRLVSPMVGRERPLQALREAFDAASDGGTSSLVTVLGPAGIGKSRLVSEFISGVGERATVLAGRCLSYGEGITYWPLAQMATEAAGISESDPPDRAREALRRALAEASDADIVTAHLAVMLGLDDGPLEAPWAVRRLFEALASRRPLVSVVDDVQWAEPAVLDVIEHIADWSDAPILLLCMARSEFLDSRPDWTRRNGNATTIVLEPLSEPESDALIEKLLGRLTSDIGQRIRSAAQGNPLFVEEMLSMMVDGGVIVREGEDWTATTDLAAIQAPPAISALLAARLDRLPDDERAVLEAASVVGEVFERSSVRALVHESIRSDLDRHLGSLLHKDLIRPSPSDIGGELGCRFRHILLRDAAYAAVPKSECAQLHASFAKYLATALGERATELDEFIGYHLEQAHRLRTELGMRDERTNSIARAASEHLAAAGHRAFQRSDTLATVNLLGRAARLLDSGDPARLGDAWMLGMALLTNGQVAAAREVLEQAQQRALEMGDDVASAYVETVLWSEEFAGPDVDVESWEASAERLIILFEGISDHRGAALAWIQKAEASWYLNRFGDAAAGGDRALEHATIAGDRRSEGEAREVVIAGLWAGAHPIPASLPILRKTLEDARNDGDRRLEAVTLRRIGLSALFLGQIDQARGLCQESRQIVWDLGHVISFWSMATSTSLVERLAGNLEAAADDLRESCEQLEDLGQLGYLSTNAAMLAEVELDRGDAAAAERWVEVAEDVVSPSDIDARMLIELARGLIAAEQGYSDAESHLRASVSLADATDSLVRQGRTRLALVRLLAKDRSAEAEALAREALARLEAKGAIVYVNEARDLLAELEAP